MMNDRLLNSTKLRVEEEDELKLRPSSLNEYIGQEDMKSNLSVFIKASNKRNEALDKAMKLYQKEYLVKAFYATSEVTEIRKYLGKFNLFIKINSKKY